MRGMVGQRLDKGWTNVTQVTNEGWTGWTRPTISGKKWSYPQLAQNTFSQVRGILINQHTSPTYETFRGDGWTRPTCPTISGHK